MKKPKKPKTLNLILILIFIYMIIFNQQMIFLYLKCQSAPESAWCALIAALLGECGICGWIKSSKEKNKSSPEKSITLEETGAPKEPEGDPEEINMEVKENDN